jgi:hypothetical protein
MKCSACGIDIKDGLTRCDYCGAKFGSSADAYVPPPQKKADTTAIWALVLSVAGLLIPLAGWMVSIVAIVLSRKSSQRISQSGGCLTGRGAAVTGMVLGILGLVSGAVQVAAFLL